MNSAPLISDLPMSRIVVRPGDRMIARVGLDLTKDQKVRVYRGICKFAKTDIRLLIVNCMKTSILWRRYDESVVCLAELQHIQSDVAVGAVNLDCSVVDLRPGETLYVSHTEMNCELRRKDIQDGVKSWAGQDIEVVMGSPR